MSKETLHNRTVNGAAWSFADNIINLSISFLVGIVLARLLSPSEYGIIGIITIFIVIANSLVDGGFGSALIKKKDSTNADYNTVFIVNLVVSLIIFVILFLSAPLIANYFKQDKLIPLTRVMSVIVVINAFSIIQRTVLVKQIDFKKQTKISFIASISSGIIGIGMALIGTGVWALVCQQVSRQLLNSVLLYIYNKWYPKFQFSVESFNNLWGFGWKLLVSGLIDNTWNQIYQVVIGRCYSTATLGLFTRAQQFASLFSSNITTVVQRVSYPALSSIQDDKAHLKEAYQKVIKITMLLSFTLMIGLAGIAKTFVWLLIGEKWLLCVPFLQILCLNMMLYPLHAINLNMLQVQGRSDLFLKLEVIKKIIAVGPLLLGIFFNIYYMLIGSVLIGFISYYLNAYYSGPFLNYSIKQQIKDILPSFIIALIMGVILYCMSFILLPYYILFFLQIIFAIIFIIIFYEKRQSSDYVELKNIIYSIMSRIKNK